MSFSVQANDFAGGRDMEWSGTSLNAVFAQRANLLRPAISQTLAQANQAGTEFARVLAPAPTLPGTSRAATVAALDRFADDALARMVVICAAIRQACR